MDDFVLHRFGFVARAEPTLQLRVSTPLIVSGAAGL
jgi:hypothetical protein